MKVGKKYYSGAHTLYRLQYHLVWIPKYRRSVMVGEVATDQKRLFYQCATMNDWWIERPAVMPDHIRMLVELPPSILVSGAVQTLKGGSSRAIRQTHPQLEEWLWGDSFWADGYFAESTGRNTEQAIKRYIENQ
jgi:putative transposase